MKTYTTIDRTGWLSGPWDNEPDTLSWTDETTGLPCLIVRHPYSGHLCGYVGVDETHPLYGQDYEDCGDIEVHGGFTFAAHCDPDGDESTSICHIPEPGKPDHVYWLGFDFHHYQDLAPRDLTYDFGGRYGETYRTVEYAAEQCRLVAQQLRALVLEE